ncbi:Broad-complex core protein isoform 6 [Folsomia candida]|uniref:Broad-complex core protein isoform 6 n=1 Tax=Folsomia candida TaxID=158441 RepID=A0A226F376_FOLCA|nr:Broad-complex core protein isoform 6 [Folsomia candida]
MSILKWIVALRCAVVARELVVLIILDTPTSMKMTEDALFNLRWDAQRSALLGSMASLYREEAFVDTTIVADNKIFKAHKLLLSASSSYLKNMLESVPALQHAVIFM